MYQDHFTVQAWTQIKTLDAQIGERSLKISLTIPHQMASAKDGSAAASADEIDENQTVTLKVLQKYLNLDSRFAAQKNELSDIMKKSIETLQKEQTATKNAVANVKKETALIQTCIANNERKAWQDQQAKKELVLSDHDMESVQREDQIKEVLGIIKTFDHDVSDFEIRNVEKVGTDNFTRYVITVISEHVRERIIYRAKDNDFRKLRPGLSKYERLEKARIHDLKQECHLKNEKTKGDFLWEVYTPEGAMKPQIVKFQSTDPKVRKLALRYCPEKVGKKSERPKKPSAKAKSSH